MIPDKIYVDKQEGKIITLNRVYSSDICYVRKDALLEWAEQEKSKTSIGLSEYDAGHENARMELLNELITKINSL